MKNYRRLPGTRRGLFRSASVWLGADHLLSVQSMRFREEYKRFYFQDVQAIVVAGGPRFHVSTRALSGAVLWLLAWIFLRRYWIWAPTLLGAAAIVLIGVWLYISTLCSCTCRIYTAVSRDEFRSVYRKWTARRFLSEVEPRIAAVQGVLEGDWPEALESRTIGPPGPAQAAKRIERSPVNSPARTTLSDIFIGILLADAAIHAACLIYSGSSLRWIGYVLNAFEVAAVCAILVQAHRGQIKPAMRKLAIATLVILGGLYYARPFLAGLAEGAVASPTSHVTVQTNILSLPASRIFDEIEIGTDVLLATAALVILLIDREEPGCS